MVMRPQLLAVLTWVAIATGDLSLAAAAQASLHGAGDGVASVSSTASAQAAIPPIVAQASVAPDTPAPTASDIPPPPSAAPDSAPNPSASESQVAAESGDIPPPPSAPADIPPPPAAPAMALPPATASEAAPPATPSPATPSIETPTPTVPTSTSSASADDIPPPPTTAADIPLPPATFQPAQAPASPPTLGPTPIAPAAPDLPPDLVVIATDVQITGATAELQQTIRAVVKTQAGRETSRAQLQQDIAAILNTGLFATAGVTTQNNPQGVTVTFQVQPIVVQTLRLSGAQALTLDVANQLFGPQLGQPISPTLLNEAVQRVNQWYSQNGYRLARVLSLQPARDGSVTIAVAEGLIRSVQLRFLNREGRAVDTNGQPVRARTQEGFVRQQIKLQPGQVFRQDLAQADLQRLSKLGIFESASITFAGDARQTDVIYNLVEGKTRGFNFGGGYNEDLGIYGTINYQDTNFSGLGQQINTNVQVGTKDVQFDARFRSPYRETDPNTPGYGAYIFRRQGRSRVFDDDISLPNGDDVRERRIGGNVSLEYPIGPTWDSELAFNYTNISLRDASGDIAKRDREGNPLSSSGQGIDDLFTLSFSATRDQRDNPVNPGNGSVLNLRTEQSLPIGRGHILSNRLEANYAQYIPVDIFKSPEGEAQFPEIVAFNLQGGTVIGDLPPYNAYLLGGPNSVRGWEANDIATSRSYILASAEYRFPIYRFIGGVLFADFGSDLGSSSSVPGDPGGKRDKPGSGFGGGVGLRFNSPIGIIRADFGVTNQGDTRFQFGFGQKF